MRIGVIREHMDPKVSTRPTVKPSILPSVPLRSSSDWAPRSSTPERGALFRAASTGMFRSSATGCHRTVPNLFPVDANREGVNDRIARLVDNVLRSSPRPCRLHNPQHRPASNAGRPNICSTATQRARRCEYQVHQGLDRKSISIGTFVQRRFFIDRKAALEELKHPPA